MLTPATRILSITATGCDCYLASGRRLILEARFETGDAAGFTAFAKSRASSVFRVLVDQIEEDFRQDSMPFLRGSARSQLLARKTGQVYRDTPFHAVASLGREADGRRDERVQLLGLTNAELLNGWLAPLSAAGIRVAGLYSPPVAAPQLLRLLKGKIGARPKRLLVVSVNRAGLRQTLVDGEVARFSRLAAVAGEPGGDFAAECLTEVNKTQQYLVGMRLLQRDEALPVLILVPPGAMPAWSRPGLLVDAVEAVFLDVAVARRAAGLARIESAGDLHASADDDARYADSLWACVIARQLPRLDFSPPWLREAFRLWRARVALWAVGAAAMLAGVGFGMERLAQSDALLGEAARLGAETRRNDLNYERTKRGFPPLPATPEHLKASVTSFEKLNARAVAPAGLLADIGQVLDRLPEFRLLRFEWQQGDGPPPNPAGNATSAAPAAQPAMAVERYEWVTLHGTVGNPAAGADPRGETDKALRTAESLRAIRGASVDIMRSPVNLSPRGHLASDSVRVNTDGSGNVEIRVARKAGP